MKKTIFAIIAALFAVAFYSCTTTTTTEGSAEDLLNSLVEEATDAALTEASFAVKGACGMCQARIEKAATEVTGVESASWDAETQTLKVQMKGDVAVDLVKKAVAAVGHDTEEFTAEESIYNALPGCCQYRVSSTEESAQ